VIAPCLIALSPMRRYLRSSANEASRLRPTRRLPREARREILGHADPAGRPSGPFAFTIPWHSACHAAMPAYRCPDAARWGRVTQEKRIWYRMMRICAGSPPSSSLIYRIATKRRWRCWAISASWRSGATTVGLSRCHRGQGIRLLPRSKPIDDRQDSVGAARRDFLSALGCGLILEWVY
jgi:hypothetical protein